MLHQYGSDYIAKICEIKRQKVDVKEGDLVRIPKVKGQFEKGYLPNWSREEFFVDKIHTKFLPDIYMQQKKLYNKSERMDKYGIL